MGVINAQEGRQNYDLWGFINAMISYLKREQCPLFIYLRKNLHKDTH